MFWELNASNSVPGTDSFSHYCCYYYHYLFHQIQEKHPSQADFHGRPSQGQVCDERGQGSGSGSDSGARLFPTQMARLSSTERVWALTHHVVSERYKPPVLQVKPLWSDKLIFPLNSAQIFRVLMFHSYDQQIFIERQIYIRHSQQRSRQGNAGGGSYPPLHPQEAVSKPRRGMEGFLSPVFICSASNKVTLNVVKICM